VGGVSWFIDLTNGFLSELLAAVFGLRFHIRCGELGGVVIMVQQERLRVWPSC
jgi:hypothetical protein